jgi:hypothetical protein
MHPRRRLINILEDLLGRHLTGDGPGSGLARQALGSSDEPVPRPFASRRAIDRSLATFAWQRLGHPTNLDASLPLREQAVAQVREEPTHTPASLGRAVGIAAWIERAALLAGQSPTLLPELARRQQPSGALLRANPDDSPDMFWFDELALLHALASAAIETADASLLAAAKRSAAYHFVETQPDHATTQPWAIHAFLLDPAHASLPDLMLHAMRMHAPDGPSEVSLLLLADALHSLRLLDRGANG